MARKRVKGALPRPGTPAYERYVTALEREERRDKEFLRRKAVQARSKRRLLARTDINEFCIQVGRDAETNERIEQTELHETFQLIADEYPRAIVMAFPESGKALTVDTLIPTPTGFVPLAFIDVGDVVFGRDGNPCTVTFATPVMCDHSVHRVTFDDGSTLSADEDHRWVTREAPSAPLTVKTTLSLCPGDCVPLTGPVGFPAATRQCFSKPPRQVGIECVWYQSGIPREYYVSDSHDRSELLTGVLAASGLLTDAGIERAGLSSTTVYDELGQRYRYESCELCFVSNELATDVCALARSLGYWARVDADHGRLRVTICFDRSDKRVLRVESIPTYPVKCISVDSDDHTYLAGRAFTVTHNTSQLSILRLLYMIGRNPNIHIALVSKTGSTSGKSARAIKEYIERNEDLREIFPELLPGNKWEDSFFTVKRSSFSKDPTVQALGLGGTLIGSRVDVLVFDDILDDENTRTPNERLKVYRRVKAFMDRLSATGVMYILTNAWHPDDAVHKLERDGTPSFRFPVVDEDGKSRWPLKWTPERLEQAREDLGPLEFARAHLCKARDEGESPFDESAIDAAFRAGDALRLVRSLLTHTLPAGAWIYTGVDLAVTKGIKAHRTAFVTVLLWPEVDGTLSRQVLWAEAGRWSSSEIRDRFLDHNQRYRPTFIVENNAAQRWIIDIVHNQADLPVEQRQTLEIVPFTTGKNKAHATFGVEGVAVEIANGIWVFPTDGPVSQFVEDLKSDMLYYSRGGHTGDLLMALWFAREGARRGAGAGRAERDNATGEVRPLHDDSGPSEDAGEAGVIVIG